MPLSCVCVCVCVPQCRVPWLTASLARAQGPAGDIPCTLRVQGEGDRGRGRGEGNGEEQGAGKRHCTSL